jgi:CheY-like chemotaxis protein
MTHKRGYLLVVEDVPDILQLLDATLKFKGYQVVTATNGQEALEIIKRERPSMIITDILMPKLDGFSLVHRLRLDADTRDIPIVFLSATYVTPEDKTFAEIIGVTHFIEKPIDFETLLPVIDQLLTQAVPAIFEPLDEIEFYDGYRKRLEAKLRQKNIQITRDEHLLMTLPEKEQTAFKASIQVTISERSGIQQLLEKVYKQLDGQLKPD